MKCLKQSLYSHSLNSARSIKRGDDSVKMQKNILYNFLVKSLYLFFFGFKRYILQYSLRCPRKFLFILRAPLLQIDNLSRCPRILNNGKMFSTPPQNLLAIPTLQYLVCMQSLKKSLFSPAPTSQYPVLTLDSKLFH